MIVNPDLGAAFSVSSFPAFAWYYTVLVTTVVYIQNGYLNVEETGTECRRSALVSHKL